MRYQGSKRRFAKAILHAIDKDCGGIYSGKYQNWIEPFVGGCNMIEHINRLRRFGYDSNRYLIAFYQALQAGWKPPSVVTKIDYGVAKLLASTNKATPEMPPHLIGFIGAFNVFGGVWFAPYVYDKPGVKKTMAQEQVRAAVKLRPKLASVMLKCCSFFEVSSYPERSIIYLDPPYANVAGYQDAFDSKRFWEVAEVLVTTMPDSRVYVSEYAAPKHWRLVWEDNRKRFTLNGSKPSSNTEKLFTL